jgi:SAM-dependent methyltransferase
VSPPTSDEPHAARNEAASAAAEYVNLDMSFDDPYRDPILYDLEYASQSDDVAFYVALARRYRGPVLELACGNGRITLPIARAGVEVHGIDLSEAMLDDLEAKLKQEPDAVRWRVRAAQGDYRALDLSHRYPLVILPFNAIHHCTSHADIRALLRGVRSVLRPGGAFVLDCYLPDPVLYARDPERRYEERTFHDPRTGGALYSWETGRWDPVRRIHHVYYTYQDEAQQEHVVHLQLHMYERAELAELFHQEGFQVGWEASEFSGAPMTEDALKWVIELRLRES